MLDLQSNQFLENVVEFKKEILIADKNFFFTKMLGSKDQRRIS